MKRNFFFYLALSFLCVMTSCNSGSQNKEDSVLPHNGHLFIIGGGDRPEYMMQKYIELAGGHDAKIIVVPFASGDAYETALYLTDQFQSYGCTNVDYVFFAQGEADLPENIGKLDGATGVYFAGGDQNELTKILLGTKFLEKIKEVHRNGGVVGGTSAGAAVMSKIMLTGEELVNPEAEDGPAFPCILKGNVEVAEGFGFIDNAIVDQHFIQRKRQNRLITLVVENCLPGIGIDEATAIIVKADNSFEVFGDRTVMIFEPQECTPVRMDKNGNLAADNITLRILLSGDTYKIKPVKSTN